MLTSQNTKQITPVVNQLPAATQATTLSRSELKCYELSKEKRTFKNLPEFETRVMIGELLTNRIFEMIGLKDVNFPTKAGARDISYFIYNRYPDFTVEDIYNAFEYALAEIIAPTSSKDDWLNHYQSFNIKYFRPILEAYRKYKSSAVDKVERKLLHRKETHDFFEIRKKNAHGIKKNILIMYKYYLAEQYSMIFTTNNEYDFLDELNLIESTPQQKLEYLNTAKALISERGKQKKQFNLSNWVTILNNGSMSLAKHKCILQLFEELSFYGLQVDNLELILENACFINPYSHEQLKNLMKNGQI